MAKVFKKQKVFLGIKTLEEAEDTIRTGVSKGEGLIAYRKYLWALWFMEKRLNELADYREQVISPIDDEIEKQQHAIQDIRIYLETAMEEDPSVPKTKTGGKMMKLPDIATVSITRSSDKVKIIDPVKVMENLGSNYQRHIVELDIPKAKRYILETHRQVPGAVIYRDKNLVIRFTR